MGKQVKKAKNAKQGSKKRRIVVVGAISFVLLVTIITLFMLRGSKLDLKIANEAIMEEQFINIMDEKKYEVTKEFYKTHGAEVNKGFWTNQYGGESPYKMLVDLTIEELSRIYANYTIARDHGYLTGIGYEDLLIRFESENQSRSEKIEKGELVYGLKEYPLDLYTQYEIDSLQKMYMNDPTNAGMDLTDEEGMEYYDEHKDSVFGKVDDVELEFVKIYYESLELEESEVKALKKDLIELSNAINEEKTMKELVTNKYELLNPYFRYEDIISEEMSAMSREMGDVLEIADDLKEGELTEVIDQNGSLYLIHIIDKEVYDYLPYENVKGNVFKSLREQKFAEIVEEKMEKIGVEGDREKIYQFAKKKLQD